MSQHTCGCGHDHGEKAGNAEAKASMPASAYKVLDTSEEEVLDVHAIPHFVRHAAILGALASLSPGFALTIKAGHLPAPLLAQVEPPRPREGGLSPGLRPTPPPAPVGALPALGGRRTLAIGMHRRVRA